MEQKKKEPVPGELCLQDMVLTNLRTARILVRELMPRTEGKDLELVYQHLGDAVVTFAGTMTRNGLPEEVNRILRNDGFEDLVE